MKVHEEFVLIETYYKLTRWAYVKPIKVFSIRPILIKKAKPLKKCLHMNSDILKINIIYTII